MNHWRNVRVERIGEGWRASAEYVCMAEGGTVYRFASSFDTEEKAKFFVRDLK